MKKLLFIDCCIRREKSRTAELARAFLGALKQRGEYEITTLTLMDEPIIPLTEGFFAQREELLRAGALDHPRFRYAHQFAEADRIVIAAPFWDLSFPALLKIYIEQVSLEGISFRCDERGCIGACRAEKLAYITTRGGTYTDTPLEMGGRYIEALCEFFGIGEFHMIEADSLDLGLESAEIILARAKKEAERLAEGF